jgi:Holliday junction resolvase-like predicted endonuclease
LPRHSTVAEGLAKLRITFQNNSKRTAPRRPSHLELGKRGEELAVEHVVAYDGPTLCFIEVKTRTSDEFASPQTNVDLRKRRQIARAARGYRRMLGLMGAAYRYDVVSVVLPSPGKQIAAQPRIELLKNFWTEEKLHKRNWYEARWD